MEPDIPNNVNAGVVLGVGRQPEAGHLHRHPLLDGPRDGHVRDVQRRTSRFQGER